MLWVDLDTGDTGRTRLEERNLVFRYLLSSVSLTAVLFCLGCTSDYTKIFEDTLMPETYHP